MIESTNYCYWKMKTNVCHHTSYVFSFSPLNWVIWVIRDVAFPLPCCISGSLDNLALPHQLPARAINQTKIVICIICGAVGNHQGQKI